MIPQKMDEAYWGGAPDALDEALANMPGATAQPASIAQPAPPPERTFTETCPNCRGSGSWRGRGQCFKCKGAGTLTFKTPHEVRSAARESVATRQAKLAAEHVATFAAEYPAEHAWMVGRAATFEFAASMLEALGKWGSLTDNQLAAVRKSAHADAERDAARAAGAIDRIANAPKISTDKLSAAFAQALSNGLKRPRLRFDGFEASMAPAAGKNAGAVYLKRGGDYLGKISDGKFFATREAAAIAPGIAAKVEAAMADPVEAAIRYGRATGTCSCCGRTLTDPESVKAGIGPVCANSFGM